MVRQGIYKRFPKVSTYEKNLSMGFWKQEDVERNLVRYVSEGPFRSHAHLPPSDPLWDAVYSARAANEDLARLAGFKTIEAMRLGLRGDDAWLGVWRQAAGYDYGAARAEFAVHEAVLCQYGTTEGRHTLFLQRIGRTIGICLSLGWTELAVDIAQRTNTALSNRRQFNDAGDRYGRRRTQHFVLRLVDDWKEWPVVQQAENCASAFDEPLFNALIANWRSSDPELLEFLLLAACDRHTHQSRVDSHSRWEFYDFSRHADWYCPYEILSVLRLRAILELPNPTLDHCLMATAWGVLPAVTSAYTDPLLDGVLERMRQELGRF